MAKDTGKTGRTAALTKIMDCTCESDYQDKRYGKGKRVHNPGANHWSCTVCGRKKDL